MTATRVLDVIGELDSPSDDDLDEIIASGDQLPVEMWEPGLAERIVARPVYDGARVVDAE